VSDLIPAADLRVTRHCEGGPGGQQVGGPYPIRVEHVPSGLVAIVDTGDSPHRCKLVAIDMILAGLTSPHMPRGYKPQQEG